MREVEVEIKNNENIIDKEISVSYGLFINGVFEYINYGIFKVTECEEVIKENKIKATAYDNMVRFMVKYNISNLNLTFPCTILQLVQAICKFIGVQLYSTNFYNADLIIETDLFSVLNCTYRDILDYICQTTCTTGIIKENKLYFKKIQNTNIVVGPKLLKTLVLKNKFGPCNSLVLGRGDLNDNIYSKDNESINQYGLQEIKFDNNEIIDKRREQVIDGMFEQIKGIEYNAFEATDLGIGFFEAVDMITVQDTYNNEYPVLILNMSIIITTGTAGTMEANVPRNSTTNYSYATDSEKRQTRTEALVNKQDNEIKLITEKTEIIDEQVNSIAQVNTIESNELIHAKNVSEVNYSQIEVSGNTKEVRRRG